MAERFFSDHWYRVSALTPAVPGELRIERRRGPDGVHYVAHHPLSGKTHRLTVEVAMLLKRLDGRTSVATLWDDLVRDLGADAPSQTDMVRLLSQLHSNDLIATELPADLRELDERRGKKAKAVTRANLMGPMSFRVPLFDPDRLIRATLPAVGWLISPLGLVLWLALLVYAGIGAATEWDAITGTFSDRVWSASSIALTAGTYIVVKALHELGHGWAARRFGAGVHETGVMFLVFMPVPYVDATEAAALPGRSQRAAVSGAGIIVETTLAALAFLIWRDLEPGFARAMAFNVMMIGGISTVLVNGNPLLKFDGYFVMTDLLGLPNLAQRSNTRWGDIADGPLFGAEDLPRRPHRSGFERLMLLIYAPAAFAYRIVLSLTIAIYVASTFFVLGVLLAAWSLTLSLGKPIGKGIWHVLTAPRLARVRHRAVGVTAGGAALVLAFLLAVPLPYATITQGVVWMPEGAELRTARRGIVAELAVPDFARVEGGTRLARLEDPLAETEAEALRWATEEARLALAADRLASPAAARLSQIALDRAIREQARAEERIAALTIAAETPGIFRPVQNAGDIAGRYFAEGALLGHILPDAAPTIRIALRQEAVARMARIEDVSIRLPSDMDRVIPATVTGQVATGAQSLPSEVLALDNGGLFPAIRGETGELRSLDRLFQYDLAIADDDATGLPLGARVHVKLAHPWRPLGPRMADWLAQQFLGGLDV